MERLSLSRISSLRKLALIGLFFSVLAYGTSFTDGVKIGQSGSPVASSILEIKSFAKGFLPPRMTTTQQNAISSPAEGLLVYDTVLHSAAIYDGTIWQSIFDAGNLTGTIAPGTIPAPAIAARGGIFSSVAVTHQYLTSINTDGTVSRAQPACSDLSNAATSCSTDATNAANISSGTLPAARLPNPSASTLGGVESIVSASHKWINAISTSGVPALTQPACGDLSDAANSCNTTAASTNTVSQIVLRDGSGNFAAGTMTGNVNATQIGINDTSAGSALFVKTSGTTVPSMTIKAITSQSADMLQIMDASNVPQMIFTSGGNFKFFHNVASPTTRMDLRGSVSQSSANSGNNARYSMFIGDPQAPAANLGAGIALGGPQTSSTDLTPYAYIWVNKNNSSSGDVGASLHFATRNNSTGNAQRSLELDSNGNADFFGTVDINGSSSGKITIQGQAAAGTYNFNLPTSAGTTGQPLLSGGGSTAQTYGTLGVSAGGTGQTSYTDGQLLIGNSSSGGIDKATLTAGSNITITNGNGSVTIAASSSASPSFNYTAQSTTYNAVVSDWVYASGASFVITLPTAVSQAGKSIVIQHTGTSLSQVYTLNTTSAQVINTPNGAIASGVYKLFTNGETLWLMSDGTGWNQISHQVNSGWSSTVATTWSATSAYVFTVTSANATIGAVYSNNGQQFIVSSTIASSVTLTCAGTGAPASSGTLTKVSGTGDATITFSSKTTTGQPVKETTTQDDSIQWRREGASIHIRVLYGATSTTGSTVGSGDYILFLPSSIAYDGAEYQTLIGADTPAVAARTIYSAGTITSGFSSGTNSSAAAIPYIFNSTANLYAIKILSTTFATGAMYGPINSGSSKFNFGVANFRIHLELTMPVTNWQP